MKSKWKAIKKPGRPTMVFKFIVPKKERTSGNEEND